MARPRRGASTNLAQEIKTIAQRRLAQMGTAGLSLRAIARELGITAPAIYNYFPRLEDLITTLIVDAYASLGEALFTAQQKHSTKDHYKQLYNVGVAYHQWASEHPEQYNLIFGTPIPGYQAPTDVTQPAAERGLRILVEILDDAYRAGEIPIGENYLKDSSLLHQQIQVWREETGSKADINAHYLALVLWTRVHGLVSIELYQQYPLSIRQPEEIFRLELKHMLAEIGLQGKSKK